MLQWSHIPCIQGNQECTKHLVIYQSKHTQLSVCLPHLNGAKRRQGNEPSPAALL